MEFLKRKLPIGIDDFEKLRKNDFYFIDKTGLIKDLLDNWGEVTLFTRPRRFGKSLNMSMLQNFFEIGTDPSLFNNLYISKNTNLYQNNGADKSVKYYFQGGKTNGRQDQ